MDVKLVKAEQANCGRYVLGHAESHWMSTRHSMALSLCDLSVWCYACDSYVHNQKLLPAKDSVYLSKFGEGLFDSKKN
uniref:UBP-type domain-containing protein n=1 Tax=Syphacia muris TaxID=451379 RepID=A0A0N5A7K1_9BILA